MVLVGVLLGVCRDGRIALVVTGRRAGRGGIISRKDGSSGLFPLRLFCVNVDVEPVVGMLATLCERVDTVNLLPFFVLVVPSHSPSGRNLGGLRGRRTRRGSKVGHRSRIWKSTRSVKMLLECSNDVVRGICGRSTSEESTRVDDVAGGYK